MDRQEELESRVSDLVQRLAADFADLGGELRFAITRALIHRAVHFATERPGVEYCTLVTYLGEMIGHAHKLAHGENPKAQSHRDMAH